MTPAQKVMLMIDLPAKNGRPASVSLFTQAAQANGWNKSDRDLRLRIFSLALNLKFNDILEVRDALEMYDHLRTSVPHFRHLESASTLNNTSDIDAVKNLLLMLVGNLEGAAEQGRPQDGQGRRFMDRLDDLLKCLALYPVIAPMGRNGAYGYALKIAKSKVHGLYVLTDLDDNPGIGINRETRVCEAKPSEREQILFTIAARLNGKTGFRATAGHSMHDMYIAAGLPCGCARCRSKAIQSVILAPLPAPVEETVSKQPLNPF